MSMPCHRMWLGVCGASGLAQGEIDAGEADGLPVSGNARPLHNPLGDLIALYTRSTCMVYYTIQNHYSVPWNKLSFYAPILSSLPPI